MGKLKKNAVLVVIDVQKGWDTYGLSKRNNIDAELKIAKLLDIWRSSGRPVVFFQHMSKNPISPLYPGQSGNEIKDVVKPVAGEYIFHKSVNSCFIGTDFEEWLRERMYDTLVITGITTQHCVSTTARMSGNLGFTTFVVSDATAAFESKGVDGTIYDPETVHAVSLATINREFATILKTEELEELL